MSQAGPRGPANVNKPPAAPATKVGVPVIPPAKAAAPAVPPPMKAAAPAASPPAPPVAPREGVRPRLGTSPGIGVGGDTPRSPVVDSSEKVQALVRTAVAEAVGAVLTETKELIRQLERRIDQLEQRPVASTAIVQASPSAASSPWAQSQTSSVASYVPVARAPVLDIGAIERSVHVEVDPALDGQRRRRRLFVVVTLFFLVVFGGLFTLLAQSYTPHH
jgi:hypothetical protein